MIVLGLAVIVAVFGLIRRKKEGVPITMKTSTSEGGPGYWLMIGDIPQGPFDVAQIQAKLASGEATWQTQACPVGGSTWLPLVQTPGIAPSLPTQEHPAIPPVSPPIATRGDQILTPPVKAEVQASIGPELEPEMVKFARDCIGNSPQITDDELMVVLELRFLYGSDPSREAQDYAWVQKETAKRNSWLFEMRYFFTCLVATVGEKARGASEEPTMIKEAIIAARQSTGPGKYKSTRGMIRFRGLARMSIGLAAIVPCYGLFWYGNTFHLGDMGLDKVLIGFAVVPYLMICMGWLELLTGVRVVQLMKAFDSTTGPMGCLLAMLVFIAVILLGVGLLYIGVTFEWLFLRMRT